MITDFFGAPLRNQILKIKAGDREIATTTDENGLFVFQKVTPNRDYSLIVGGHGVMVIQVPDRDLVMNIGGLNSPIRIQGRALDPAGAPMPDLAVSLNRGAIQIAQAQTGEDGRFTLSGPPDQDYTLRIAVDGSSETKIQIDAEDQLVEPGSVVIQPDGRSLPPLAASVRGARISGRVTDANGVALSGKVLSFIGEDISGQPRSIQLTNNTLVTDSAGFFVFPADANHEYDFFVVEPGRPAVYKFLGKITVPQGIDINIGAVAMGSPRAKNQPLEF